MLALRGCIAACTTDTAAPAIPFWPLLFKNICLDFHGSDDSTPEAEAQAAQGATHTELRPVSSANSVE